MGVLLLLIVYLSSVLMLGNLSAALRFTGAIPGSFAVRRFRNRLQAATEDMSVSLSTDTLLTEIEQGPIPMKTRKFRINGWRWHTQAVIRDLNRFEDVLRKSKDNMDLSPQELTDRLLQCHKFVCDFNWAALMRVEREIFYPWLRDLLPEQSRYLAAEFTRSHKVATDLSSRLGREILSVRRGSPESFRRTLYTIGEMRACAERSQKLQETIFVPFIAAFVPIKEQEVFNRKVIKKLGLLESQVHLVGMQEAIANDKLEQIKFRQQIPRVVQAAIPVWRKTVYVKRTSCFEQDFT